MLRAVRLVTQWVQISRGLPEGWTDARVRLTVANPARYGRAAALLGPLAPGRAGGTLRFSSARDGSAPSPGAVQRALRRLDLERIRGTLELVAADAQEANAAEEGPGTLAEAWDEALAAAPEDWTDLYGEITLTSSDDLDPAALDLAPVNPARFGATPAFRFRCARSFGYGASPGMVRRSLARLDERGVPGRIEILRVLADSRPVGTQGPVWYVGGKVI